MIQRFQIEDLIVQDASGVVFRALDTVTGKTVAVRRFFPFGVDGGGLHDDEKTAYDIAIGRLAGISHPALRSVVCGGCDPVDGMPYIATEWVEGESLLPILAQGPLSAEAATELITKALEVCELLSHVLAEEAVWVETDVQTIVIGCEDCGRKFTFWISPLKWLGAGDEPRGLESIVSLTEEIMGWKGKAVNDQAGRGLGAWLNWLRVAAPTTSLHEARESLAASIGAEPPAPAKKLVTRAARPLTQAKPKPIKRSKPKTLLLVNILLACVVAGLGGWVWIRKNPEHRLAQVLLPKRSTSQELTPETEAVPAADAALAEPAPLPPSAEPVLSEEERRFRANQLAKEGIIQDPPKPAPKPAPKPRNQPAPKPVATLIQWDNRELFVQNDRKPVILEGVVQAIDESKSGKTLYLRFSKEADKRAAQAGMEIKNATKDAVMAKLKPFVGRKVQVSGTVQVQKSFGNDRPDIMIGSADCIKIVP